MCSDSRITSDYKASAKKIWRFKGGIVGIAGNYGACVQFVKWLKGERDEEPDMDGVEAMVLTNSGKIMHYDGQHEPFEVDDDFSAIGSGATSALGALHAGVSLERAIEIAGLVDPSTGGRTQSLEIKPKRKSTCHRTT